ncbi:MAG: hypothetical protein R3D68_19615 [Hyphomicrobiaceae bacterium]
MQLSPSSTARTLRRTVSLLCIGLGGCSTTQESISVGYTGGSTTCVDDSRQCIDQRQAALRAMMADRQRTWVRAPASPATHAAGVRLFAFKNKKKELSCEELAIGLKEAGAAPGVLRGSGGRGLSTAQIARGAMLATEVERELVAERRRRCRA